MSEGVTGSDGGGGKLIRVGAFAILSLILGYANEIELIARP